MVEGERLKALLVPAQRRVVLCAPFMQARVVETLLSVVADDVMVRIVTRWRAVEVAAGVSDLGVFEVANRRPRTELLLLNDLHAKLFVADDHCLVGSANLTGAALGWSEFSNLELLVSVPVQNEDVAVLLQQLNAAEPATVAMRSEIEREAAALQVGTWTEGSPVMAENRARGMVAPVRRAHQPVRDLPESAYSPRRGGDASGRLGGPPRSEDSTGTVTGALPRSCTGSTATDSIDRAHLGRGARCHPGQPWCRARREHRSQRESG